jgi:hypothetical protein
MLLDWLDSYFPYVRSDRSHSNCKRLAIPNTHLGHPAQNTVKKIPSMFSLSAYHVHEYNELVGLLSIHSLALSLLQVVSTRHNHSGNSRREFQLKIGMGYTQTCHSPFSTLTRPQGADNTAAVFYS